MEGVGGSCCLPNQGVMFVVAGAGDTARKRVVAVCDVDGEEVVGWIGFAWREEITFVLTMGKRW